ncbi:MAG: hypothetical protein WC561_02565 [Candidatus Omnitrophota bacterium]
MLFKRKSELGAEQRRYVRLDTVFPVQFRLESPDRQKILSEWIQGFTSNISRGGICLAVHNLSPELFKMCRENKAILSLEIELPIMRRPINALASISWAKEFTPGSRQSLLGLGYTQIDARHSSILMRYAWSKKIFIPLVIALIVILSAALSINAYSNHQLTKNNKALVEELVGVLQESKQAKARISQFVQSRKALQEKIDALEAQIGSVITQEANKVLPTSSRGKEINERLIRLNQEKNALAEKLLVLSRQELLASQEVKRLDQKQAALEKISIDKMYNWLTVHQNPRTGLSMSFEGDKDIANWAFTYDQALLIQAYNNAGDIERAKKLLDFYSKHADTKSGWFFNAYYVNDGTPAEIVMHSGPNIWLGLAVMQYTHKTGDKSYLRMAERIAANIIALQNKDEDAGIRGGPDFSWYATEHNLDAYAFFNMLFKATGNNKYKQARDASLAWLLKHTYDRQDIPIKRGKGDATIATDTYAWSIAAIGPEKLISIGMDPDKILEFVEENCRAEVSFRRPNGQTVMVNGFDFAPQRHLARGGVVSSEWTGQMVVSFKIMADYYLKKGDLERARVYTDKANEYLAQLGNMIISSSSPSGQGEGCLPYATQDYVDTGHGWMTPKGSHTGSVSGTAYTIFAYYGFNPLEIKE